MNEICSFIHNSKSQKRSCRPRNIIKGIPKDMRLVSLHICCRIPSRQKLVVSSSSPKATVQFVVYRVSDGAGLALGEASSVGIMFKQSRTRYQYPFPKTDISELALYAVPVHVLGKLVSVLEALDSITPVPDPNRSRNPICPFDPNIAIQ